MSVKEGRRVCEMVLFATKIILYIRKMWHKENLGTSHPNYSQWASGKTHSHLKKLQIFLWQSQSK